MEAVAFSSQAGELEVITVNNAKCKILFQMSELSVTFMFGT
jgi:hypothetical protein